VLSDFEADGVVYLELRTTPRAIPAQGIDKTKYVDLVLGSIEEFERNENRKMKTKLILSVDRRNTLDEAFEVIDLAKRYHCRGVVGVDLCGDPMKGPVTTFAPAFQEAKSAGLKITLHFAEAIASSTDEELWELLSWGPERIGHVIHVNDTLKAEIMDRRIGVELCLSCNVHAKMITGSFGEHHFGWWKKNYTRVALSVSFLLSADILFECETLAERS
jgi:adenosine deaminase